jgi:hypothetical protein
MVVDAARSRFDAEARFGLRNIFEPGQSVLSWVQMIHL